MATGWWTKLAAVVLTGVAGLFALAGEAQASSSPEPDIVQTGQFVPGLEPYDRIVARTMRDHRIPGAAVAVVRHGRLVYARGFGMADRLREVPVQPDSLFRIASLSKPITAVAVLKLVEDGRLELDARVFRDLLAGIEPHPPKDPRMNEITVRDLLRHSGGFDRDRSGDVQWEQKKISRKLRKSPPLDCADVIAYMKRQRLDFSPGERYAYSNFGYCALRSGDRAGVRDVLRGLRSPGGPDPCRSRADATRRPVPRRKARERGHVLRLPRGQSKQGARSESTKAGARAL